VPAAAAGRAFEATPLWDIALRPFAELMAMEDELRALEERMAAGEEAVVEPYGTLQERFAVAGGYEYRANARRVLTGLGFGESEFDLPFNALSGGQRTRLMLALVLLEDADLLLLDEPENHLDISAREWLETFLNSWPRAFVIISHDREMLNAVSESIIELDGGMVKRYAGNYDAFVAAKSLAMEQQQKAFTRQQEFIRREEAWIDRFRYKNTKARAVQSRIKRLSKMERVDEPTQANHAPRFTLGEVVRTGEIVLSAEHLTMGYESLPLYSDVSFEVQRGERIGIIGPNGSLARPPCCATFWAISRAPRERFGWGTRCRSDTTTSNTRR
jgi:ATP-binding cassette, subfamily F, member 3